MRPEEQVDSQSIKAVPGSTETVRDQDKIMLVLAYLGAFALIPLLTVKDSEFVQWHAKNGLVLGLGGGIALSVLSFVPIINFIVCLLWPALVIIDLLAMFKSFKGMRWRLPGVADLADKL